MIGYLRGPVLQCDPAGRLVLDVAGVGYELTISLQTVADMRPGDEARLWVHTHVREDQLALFGFATQGERELFLLLLSVAGVGPRSAMAALGAYPGEDLARAIASGNRALLQKVPGVGKKTAERIILDLQDKVAVFADDDPDEVLEDVAAPASEDRLRQEAAGALVTWGFKAKEVEAALDKTLKDAAAIEALEQTADAAERLSVLTRRALDRLMGRTR